MGPPQHAPHAPAAPAALACPLGEALPTAACGPLPRAVGLAAAPGAAAPWSCNGASGGRHEQGRPAAYPSYPSSNAVHRQGPPTAGAPSTVTGLEAGACGLQHNHTPRNHGRSSARGGGGGGGGLNRRAARQQEVVNSRSAAPVFGENSTNVTSPRGKNFITRTSVMASFTVEGSIASPRWLCPITVAFPFRRRRVSFHISGSCLSWLAVGTWRQPDSSAMYFFDTAWDL